jgi:hypothetical protein
MLLQVTAAGQDSLFVQKLLQRIEQLQIKENGIFPAGSFPSYRLYAWNKDRYKADVNPFFTGLIAMTLRDIRPWLDTAQQRIAGHIIDRSIPAYAKFRNRSGRPTYNFWPTDTPAIFPHSGWINHFNKSQALPDDLDDTGIILLAMGTADSTARQVHQLMQSFTNNDAGKVRNTFKAYSNIGAYSTWFGKKMPVDFDICVLSNVLYMVQSYHLAWTAADSASLDLMVRILKDRRHLDAASYVSPHYRKSSIILYHLSRLMSVKPIPALEQYKPQLIADAQKELATHQQFHEQLLLSTALMRWGVRPPEITVPLNGNLNRLTEDESFSFFIANIASMFPDPLKRWAGASGITRFYYYCPAYNNLLLLENLVWRKRMDLHLQ